MTTYNDIYNMISNMISASVHVDCIYLYCDTCPLRWCFYDSYF